MHWSYKTLLYSCAALASFGMAGAMYAESRAISKDDADAVRAASKELQTAARRGDENALRKLWTPDGEYIDASGEITKAGDLISRLVKSPPADPNPAADSASETTIRFVTPDVAIEAGQADFINATDGGLLTRRLTTVWVKRDEQWLIDHLHEDLTETTALNEHLRPLDWLLGEWVGTTDDAAILVSSRWSGGGNYILREFVFAHEGGETVLGTQRIGWDPVGGRIKSWTFDSQGGTGEEQWRHEGQRWLVDTIDVSPDGKQGKTSSSYVPGNDQSYIWEAPTAEVAGAKLKPMRVEFRRAAEHK